MSDNLKYGYGKYVWIIGVVSVLGLFGYLESIGLEIECEDKVCQVGEECLIECSVYNPTYRSVYLFNHDDWKITFSPDIVDADLYVKYYGKWRFTNFTRATRFPNIVDERKYVFVFPRRTTKYFQIRVNVSEPSRIKWDFGELDPLIVSWDYIYENKSREEQIYDLIEVKSVYNDTTKSWNKAYNYTKRSKTGKIVYYRGERIGLKLGNADYDFNTNIDKEDYLYHCIVPVGDRNWVEYPYRQYEIDKGVCTRTKVLDLV